jgi:uronate dehydrogenase
VSGTVLVTGAAGRIGSWLRAGLPELGWAVRGLDVAPVTDARPGEENRVADATDPDAVRSAESTWAAIEHSQLESTHVALEAARRAGVQRVVLASSNHATGWTPRPAQGLLTEAGSPPRPDTYYGVAKVAMEALGSLYADRYGLDVVCLRIGSALPEPLAVRHLATWLSPGDTVRLVQAALTAPAPGYRVVWGVSANTRGWWDRTAARALGYDPADDAESYAAALIAAHGEADPTDPVHARVGGEYTLPDMDVDVVAARAAGGRA